MVHFMSEISRLLTLGLLPSIVLIKRPVAALCQLSLIQTRELKLGPGGNIVVLLDKEDLKAIIGELDAVLGACEVDREREVNHLDVPDLGNIDFQTELREDHINVLAVDVADGK